MKKIRFWSLILSLVLGLSGCYKEGALHASMENEKVYSEYEDNEDVILPDFKNYPNGEIDASKIEKFQHFTKPAPRYTEASLIKEMESLGIGRPSTYATIMKTILDRGYVKLEDKKFFPTDIGFETTEFALLVNGRADAFNSNSISKGYGNVLASAWRYLPKIAQGYTVKDVVAFKKLLNSNPTTKIQKENQEFALKAEQTAMPALNRSIISNLNAILGTTDDLRTIYLYGGGSIPLVEKADLIDQINASLQNYRSDAPVIWLGEKFSSIANLMGLEILAKALAKTLNKS